MQMVEQIISDLRQESCVFCRLEASEPWRILKDQSRLAPFYVVLSGQMRVTIANDLYDLSAGDFMVMPRGAKHELASPDSVAAQPVDLLALFKDAGVELWKPGVRLQRIAQVETGGGGPQTVMLIGVFSFGDPKRNPLLDSLPQSLVVRGGADEERILPRSILNAIEEELQRNELASNLTIAKLADLLFVQALRTYLSTTSNKAVGWVRGMTDPRIGRAITAMHAAPERRWTVQSLAAEVGSSRAVFAKRFSALIGQGVLGYLTSWRMHLAASLLLERGSNIADVARRVGYRNETAFAIAFKRWSGVSPSEYRGK